MEIVTLQDAIAKGQRWYFTGEPCPHGHIAKRSTANRDCRHCGNMRRAAKRAADPEKVRAADRKAHHRRGDARRAQSRASWLRHREVRLEYDRKRYARKVGRDGAE